MNTPSATSESVVDCSVAEKTGIATPDHVESPVIGQSAISRLKRNLKQAVQDLPPSKRKRPTAAFSALNKHLPWDPPTDSWRQIASEIFGVKVATNNLEYATEFTEFCRDDPPRQKVHIHGDGNCFYRSISAVITGDHSRKCTDYEIVKEKLFDFMAINSKVIDNLTSTENYAKTSGTRLPNKWATEHEITAMASLLKTPIAVYCKYGPKWSWSVFEPNYRMASQPFNNHLVYLFNTNQNHYEPVISIEQQ